MGQTVTINKSLVFGDTLILDTDRSLTGQDGHAIARGEEGEAIPGRLAARLFATDPAIDHVYVLQNTVTIRRRGGWDEAAVAAVAQLVEGFLRYY